MTSGKAIVNRKTASAIALALSMLQASAVFAQGVAPGYPQAPAYPQAPGYPQAQPAYPAAPMPAYAPTQQMAPPSASHPMRELFAGTIATLLQTASGGLVGALNGSITNWFAKKSQVPTAAYAMPATAGQYPGASYPAAPAYPASSAYPAAGGYPASSAYPGQAASTAYPPAVEASAAYPSANAYPPTTGYPSTSTYPPTTGYPSASGYPSAATPAYPATATTGAASSYPAQSSYPAPTTYPAQQAYPAQTAYPAQQAYPAQTTSTTAGDSTLYAGIAYEVHALTADGRSTAIDAASYEFRSGDKFMVYYRPSMPGRMDVYNVNPAGQQTLIDSSNMAAGQMTGLGPYQFTNLKGDESLRLILSPCSDPQLLAATRDIVRADGAQNLMAPSAYPTAAGVQLSSCGAPGTRGLNVHTRDIQKVAVDGTTSYALDPVSQQERASGQVTPREANIVFHHR